MVLSLRSSRRVQWVIVMLSLLALLPITQTVGMEPAAASAADCTHKFTSSKIDRVAFYKNNPITAVQVGCGQAYWADLGKIGFKVEALRSMAYNAARKGCVHAKVTYWSVQGALSVDLKGKIGASVAPVQSGKWYRKCRFDGERAPRINMSGLSHEAWTLSAVTSETCWSKNKDAPRALCTKRTHVFLNG